MYHQQSMESMFVVTITQEYFLVIREAVGKARVSFFSLETSSSRDYFFPSNSMIYASNKSININTHVANVITERESTTAAAVSVAAQKEKH